MRTIKIKNQYADGKWDIVDKINRCLIPFGLKIELIEEPPPKPDYNYNRSYMTNERARDVRLDRTSGPGLAW
jgi:hypothetical protein